MCKEGPRCNDHSCVNVNALLLLLTALAAPRLAAYDAALDLRSGPSQTALVELFTSEGCSSCPPAERWLGGFVDRPELWRDFVPVVWHVDYWDGLGWTDRFATPANTRRQEHYSAVWGSRSIYTPGFVLNGGEWRGWNHMADFTKAAKASAGVLEVKDSGTNRFSVTFIPSSKGGEFEATVVWLGSDLVSDVKRGENAGYKLRHNFVALRTAITKLQPDGDSFANTVTLPRPEERDSARLALAAWVTSAGEPIPLQAVGGWAKK